MAVVNCRGVVCCWRLSAFWRDTLHAAVRLLSRQARVHSTGGGVAMLLCCCHMAPRTSVCACCCAEYACWGSQAQPVALSVVTQQGNQVHHW